MNFSGGGAYNTSKYPSEDLDYGIDYYYTAEVPWLLVDESIISSTWEVVTGDGALTLYNETFTKTGTVVWIRGGTEQELYVVVNRITTDKGRTGTGRFQLYITSPTA